MSTPVAFALWARLVAAVGVEPPAAMACDDLALPGLGAGLDQLYPLAQRADACGKPDLAARAYERALTLARAQGLTEPRGVISVGLARAQLVSPEVEGRRARLEAARDLLVDLLTEADAEGRHHPETMPRAKDLLPRIESALRDLPPDTVEPPPPAPVEPPHPPTSTTATADVPSPRVAGSRPPRSVVAGVATAGVLVVAGVGLATVAISVRPWYGQRYRDDAGYTIPIARDLTRPWVVGYAVAGGVTTLAGATLLAIFAPRLRRARVEPRTKPH